MTISTRAERSGWIGCAYPSLGRSPPHDLHRAASQWELVARRNSCHPTEDPPGSSVLHAGHRVFRHGVLQVRPDPSTAVVGPPGCGRLTSIDLLSKYLAWSLTRLSARRTIAHVSGLRRRRTDHLCACRTTVLVDLDYEPAAFHLL